MSPEYAIDGLFSVKSDVFSFGVIVLEIMSGKRNRGFSHRDHHHNLIGHVSVLSWSEYSYIFCCIKSSSPSPLLSLSILAGMATLQRRKVHGTS